MSEPNKQIFNLNIETVANSPKKVANERRGLQHFKIFNQQRREIKSTERQQVSQAMDTNSETTNGTQNKIDLLLKNALKKQVKQKTAEIQDLNLQEIRQNLKKENKIK